MKQRVRSIFISDVHLGCRYSRADLLLEFLDQFKADNLYLVGDIIDGWKLKRKPYWDIRLSLVLRKIIGMMKKGTQVYYVTGNHDEFLRNHSPMFMENLYLVDEAIHETVDGKKMLIIHGDVFDHITRHMKWLYRLGDVSYSFALFANSIVSRIRRKLGLRYWSFSQMLKSRVKQAVAFIDNFEHFVVKHTKMRKCDGVICGHIHVPVENKLIEDIRYYNCGDWIENCTALVEYHSGEIRLEKFIS